MSPPRSPRPQSPPSASSSSSSVSGDPFPQARTPTSPYTPLPPYPGHHRTRSMADALEFVDKYAVRPTRRSRTRSLAVALLVGLGLGVTAIGHSTDVVARISQQSTNALKLVHLDQDAVPFGNWTTWFTGSAWDGTEQAQEEDNFALEQSTADEPTSETNSAVADLALDVPAEGPTAVSALPRPRLADPSDKETNYIGYLPHSGYHNQRIGLENALLMGHLLNRTVLIPPIWIGWPPFTDAYVRLQREWTTALSLNPNSFQLADASLDSELSQPISFASSENDQSLEGMIAKIKQDEESIARQAANHERQWRKQGWQVRPDGYPITNLTAGDCKSYSVECRHTYKDTFLAWDFVANLDSAAEEVPIVDRWDIRQRALLPSLGLEEKDVFVLRDMTKRDFLYSDVGKFGEVDAPLLSRNSDAAKYDRTVSLGALRQVPQRLLLVGSLFGSGKIETVDPARDELQERFSRSLAFRNPHIVRPADAIALRLGNSYLGVHARVGDGNFRKAAMDSTEASWRWLMRQIGVGNELAESIWDELRPSKLARRHAVHLDQEPSLWADMDEDLDEKEDTRPSPILEERAPITDDAIEWTMRNLTCRAPLHTDPDQLKLNKPLYLATDSRDPANDPALAIFFKTFPCTFILSDFDRPSDLNSGVVVESVEEMGRLENANDGLPLGRLFLPFLEAVIAAKADVVVGTRGSTFSAFAEGAMHRAYEADKRHQRSRV